jgi:uncharacterized protein YjbJ (UPF0337 family)
MNKDIMKGKWKELRGRVKAWWGQLTDNDLDQIQGRYDQLVGKLQERYGYTRQEAEGEIRKFFKQADAQIKERG